MKDIVNVSIAGIAFRLDADAYARLSGYLDRIRAGYGDSLDGGEILGDLEARIAELILTEQDTGTVVPLSLIDSALAQLGEPEGVIDPAMGGSAAACASASGSSSSASIPCRLYRNPEGAKLGGVCTGLGAYFNLDPALVRLIFAAPLVLMVFFFILHAHGLGRMMTGFMTTAFILYILLWIVIPKARTPLQKLEMKGEKITRDKLEQTYRAEFDHPGNAPRHIVQRARNARDASVFSEIVSIVGRIVLFFLKAVVALIGFSLAFAMIAVLGALAVSLFDGPDGFRIGGISPGLSAVIVCVAVLIPLGLAVYGILKFLFGFRHNRPLVSTLATVWVLTLVFGTVIFIKEFDNIRVDDRWSIGWIRDGGDRERLAAQREILRHRENGLWNSAVPLAVTGDALHVVRADSLTRDFVLRLHHRGDTTLMQLPDYRLSGDTLYLHAPAEAGQPTDVLTTVPVRIAVGIDYNEYYEH